MQFGIGIDPLLPWTVIAAIAAASAALILRLALSRHPGIWLRCLALLILFGGILNPSLSREHRELHPDVVVVVEDRSDSQGIGSRSDSADAAVDHVASAISELGGVDVVRAVFRNVSETDQTGTALLGALDRELARIDGSRLAGVILVSDGQVHDAGEAPDIPVPVHALITGGKQEFDRRIEIVSAPAFVVTGEEAVVTVAVKDSGKVPDGMPPPEIAIELNGFAPVTVASNEQVSVQISSVRRGLNHFVATTPTVGGEITYANNIAHAQINGIEDRLRVLLVSGFPHAGQRTWRNMLKSDDSIDLVHFTILRLYDDDSIASPSEMSLIPFPVNELFLEKVQSFDLIILDRVELQSILPPVYLHYVRNYVHAGGAILVAAGPEFAGEKSLHLSALQDILPGHPTGEIYETGFRPRLTDVGRLHPVTSGLQGAGDPASSDAEPEWGRWFRQVALRPVSGNALMEGIPDGGPLLVLDEAGAGRIALLASDQGWLWHRGVDGGGPQLELLRRLIHWLMREPDLEVEALQVNADGSKLTVEYRTLGDLPPDIEILGGDGFRREMETELLSPGKYLARSGELEPGQYLVAKGQQTMRTAAVPDFPVEFQSTTATDALLKPIADGSGGGVFWIEDGLPELRRVREGRVAAGEDWAGLVRRNAYSTVSIDIVPLLPALLAMTLAVLAMAAAWWRESGDALLPGSAKTAGR